MSRLKRLCALCALSILLTVASYAANAQAGLHAVARTAGTIRVNGLTAPVRIVRDARSVPHIIASSDRDLYFAQGYAEASDRLFQMDLMRRFVRGTLAEVLGSAALPEDEHARIVPIADVVRSEWARLPKRQRVHLQAFADGANEAMRTQPLPAEFRLLLYKPQPWTPQDSLVTGFSTVLDLIDRWDDVVRRDTVLRELGPQMQRDLYAPTDPQYDAPVTAGGIAAVPRLHDRTASGAVQLKAVASADQDAREASNEWAVGGGRSTNGQALLANDPHLRLSIPGVWYLVELRSPRTHAAGATLAGVPGVVLGHNERIAWGATNGTVVTEVVYEADLRHAVRREETFHVRFAKDVRRAYLSTARGFAIDGRHVVDWNAVRLASSPLAAFAALNDAGSIAQGMQALRLYPGPPQNFVLASTDGTAAYHLAGLVPDDPSWGLRVHARSDPLYGFVPFDRLPHVDAARDAAVFTANNRPYGAGYPLRLSANFSPPYRAKRIAELLAGARAHDAAAFFAMQSDTLSLPERELAADLLAAIRRKGVANDPALLPYVRELRGWNGRFERTSRAATLMYAFRRLAASDLASYNAGGAYGGYIASAQNADLILLLRVLRERPKGWWPASDYDDFLLSTLRRAIGRDAAALLQPWSTAGAVEVKHPLAPLGLNFLNGGALPGDGDAFALHVLTPSPHSQSFRAVWDTGDWDAGGIILPSGESGEPGSGHYNDERAAWTGDQLQPLPFTRGAVQAAARETLTLTP
ncbi:MAG: penicillin acylase family protein [Candidatus Baltobacteraceae bacterium]